VPLSPEQWTLIGMLVAIGAAGAARQWVFGWVHDRALASLQAQLDEMREDRDFWRDAHLRGLNINDKAIEVAKKVRGA
jgi:hypothetical protein